MNQQWRPSLAPPIGRARHESYPQPGAAHRGYASMQMWRGFGGTKVLPASSVMHSSYDGSVKYARVFLSSLAFTVAVQAQIIEFESGGLKFKTMTRNGITVMFAHLPLRVLDYAILQVAVSNGASISWTVKPEEFRFERADGRVIPGLPARTVVGSLIDRAGRSEVIKLVAAYEASLYNNAQIHSTNGYEVRRQNAFAEIGSSKLKAAAAASAIAMVTTKLAPGQSTDGAVFYPNQGKPLGAGKLIVNTAGEMFEFPVEAEKLASK